MFKYSAFFLSILLYQSTPVNACTRVFWNNNSIAKVVTRTMDLGYDDSPKLIVSPKGIKKNGGNVDNPIEWTSKYGNIGILSFDVALSDGMNSEGLAAHLIYLHGSEYERRDNRKGLSNAKWAEYILDNFKSVQEALDNLRTFQIVSSKVYHRKWPIHLIIEDASGDSAILEYTHGKLLVYHSNEYRVATNEPSYDIQLKNIKNYRYFGGSLPLPGDVDPLARFVRASAFLHTLSKPSSYIETLSFLLGVIRTTQVPFGAIDTSGTKELESWPTRWISAADLTNKTYFFNTAFNPNTVWINLENFDLSEGAPMLELDVDKLKEPSKDITKRFTTRKP